MHETHARKTTAVVKSGKASKAFETRVHNTLNMWSHIDPDTTTNNFRYEKMDLCSLILDSVKWIAYNFFSFKLGHMIC